MKRKLVLLSNQPREGTFKYEWRGGKKALERGEGRGVLEMEWEGVRASI